MRDVPLRLLIVAVGLLVVAPRAGGADGARRSIRAEYGRLLEGGCDLARFGVATPIEARVLRNVPYAVAGQRFKSEDLSALYAADGDWYAPRRDRAVLGKPDIRCVTRLNKHEAVVRKQLPIDKGVEAVLTRAPKVFWALRDSTRYPNKYRDASSRTGEQAWSWSFVDGGACGGDGSPQSTEECSGLSIMCSLPDGRDWKHLECDFIWAG